YLRAFEHFVFGETYLGYLSLILALPFLVYALFGRFLPSNWATVVTLGFVATPIGALFGSAYLYYVKWAARRFADPSGYILLLAAGGALSRGPDGDAHPPIAPAFFGAMLLAVGAFVRPNVALASGVMALGAIVFAARRRAFARAGAVLAGFATLAVSPLHNWV